jgi:hypothetical protein
MIVCLSLLSLSEDSFAQSSASHDKTVPYVEENTPKNEQDCPVEADLSIPSQLSPSHESTITREKPEDTIPQEGIKDAFSKDHGDRFQPKDEKTNEVKSGKEPENRT